MHQNHKKQIINKKNILLLLNISESINISIAFISSKTFNKLINSYDSKVKFFGNKKVYSS